MNRLAAPSPTLQPWMRRLAADLFLFVCFGVVMAFLGPFGTSEHSLARRLVYWQYCMVGGGLFGVAIDEPLRRRAISFWPRVAAVSVLMTPLVTLHVELTNVVLYDARLSLRHFQDLWFQVLIVCFMAMIFRQFAWAHAPAQAAQAAEPAPDPTEAFRRRLSAKKRAAAILAIEAEDHYLRVHTDAGDELITARLRDALTELSAAPGFHIHRSWWVAAEAIDEVRWLRGRGELRLKSGLIAPVSRGQAGPLREAGWF